MISSFFTNLSLRPAIAISAIAFMFYYFFDAEAFIYVFNLVLLFCGLSVIKNIPLLSIVLIIATVRLGEYTIWYLPLESLTVKIAIYLFSLLLCIWLRWDNFIKLFTVLFISVFSAEVYWYFTDYPAPGGVVWGMILSSFAVGLRSVFLMRPVILAKFTKQEPVSLDLDFYFYILLSAHFLVHALTVAEYLVRHLTTLNPLIIWTYSAHVTHALNVIIISLFFYTSSKELSKQIFKA